MKVISISNHKGGCGKTTTTLNLGAALARMGKNTLLIDLDAQANLTQSLGVTNPAIPNIYEVLKNDVKIAPLHMTDNLDLVPSTLDLSGIDLELAGEIGREYKLKDALGTIAGQYDYILLDCPPSLGLLTLNALVASNSVIIPLQAQYLALQGMKKLMEIIGRVKKRLNPNLNLDGIVITQYDRRKVLCRDIATTIGEHYPGKVLCTKIRDNVALAEAPANFVDIFRYDKKSAGAIDYEELAKEVDYL